MSNCARLLAENGIRVLELHELDARARSFVDEYCERELDLLLTPVTVDPAHPFPRVINKALCVAFLLRRRRRSSMTYTGVVTVPRALPRLVRLPSEGTVDFIFLADLVAHHASRMYHGYDIVSSAAFRVTRNSNLYLAEEESAICWSRCGPSCTTGAREMRFGWRLSRMPILRSSNGCVRNFELESWQVLPVNGPVNLSRLFNIYEQTEYPELKFKPFNPRELRLTAKSTGSCSKNCDGTMYCCTIHLTLTTRWCRLSSRRRKIRACSLSSRRSTAPASTR